MKLTCGNRISLWAETEENVEMETFPENPGHRVTTEKSSYKTRTEVGDKGDKATLPVEIHT